MRRARGDSKRSTQLAVQMEHRPARVPVRAPLLPHEHDESPETSPLEDPVAVQAHADLSRGLIDTERRGDATQLFNRHRPRGRKGTRG
jgi:hypothetical protein